MSVRSSLSSFGLLTTTPYGFSTRGRIRVTHACRRTQISLDDDYENGRTHGRVRILDCPGANTRTPPPEEDIVESFDDAENRLTVNTTRTFVAKLDWTSPKVCEDAGSVIGSSDSSVSAIPSHFQICKERKGRYNVEHEPQKASTHSSHRVRINSTNTVETTEN